MNNRTVLLSRRRFVHTAAAATLGLASAPAWAATATATRPLRVGFLGAAHSHALEKVKVVKESPEFELVGISEPAAAARAPFEPLGVKVLSRDDLLSLCEIIAVESAVRDHARDARAALEAGRHVQVEKPPAATRREFEDLVRLARRKNRLLQVGYMWRFNPGVERALDAARLGWLGDVYLVRATMNSSLDARRRPEWGEFRGGAMFELGCHLLDIVVRLLGRPLKVTPHLQRRGPDSLADNCVAILEYPKAQVIVTTSALQPNAGPHRFLEILGTNGLARVQPIEPPGLLLELAKPAGPYAAGAQKVELPGYRRYVGEFAELARLIRDGKPQPVSLETELLIQETVLQASNMP